VDWHVSLEYPNGRTHETVISAGDDFGPGFEFELYGRLWRAVGRGASRTAQWTLCECVGMATLL
jgi:hypothetical protein